MTRSDALGSLLIPLLLCTMCCGGAVYHFSAERTEIKQDYSSVNSIKYGMLSVDIWKDRIRDIVSNNIGEFALGRTQENDLKKVISNVLQALITETDTLFRNRNKTLSGKIKKFVVSAFFNLDDIRKKVPALTETIISEIKKPANSAKLKHVAQIQLDEYSDESYDNNRDIAPLNRILIKYQTTSTAAFNNKTKGLIRDLDRQTTFFSRLMLGDLCLFLGVWWLCRKNAAVQKLLFSLGVAFALVFLITAITIPMMEIDARIDSVDILLVGKHLQFKDQVIFYRSKSILQVVKTMLDTGAVDSQVVGILILAFSIFFPISKLISTEWYLLGGEKIRTNKWIQFFAFKSGKWSMADVMVIAMFMTYIGFNGILKSQLENINIKTQTLESISTSGTSLQPGFMLFATFVLFGLFLSFILEKIAPHPNKAI